MRILLNILYSLTLSVSLLPVPYSSCIITGHRGVLMFVDMTNIDQRDSMKFRTTPSLLLEVAEHFLLMWYSWYPITTHASTWKLYLGWKGYSFVVVRWRSYRLPGFLLPTEIDQTNIGAWHGWVVNKLWNWITYNHAPIRSDVIDVNVILATK